MNHGWARDLVSTRLSVAGQANVIGPFPRNVTLRRHAELPIAIHQSCLPAVLVQHAFGLALARIDLQAQLRGLRLADELFGRTERQNAPGAHEQGQAVERRGA